MSQENNDNPGKSGAQGRQGGNNRNRNRNRTRNRNRPRQGGGQTGRQNGGDSRSKQSSQKQHGRQSGGGPRRRQPKPLPLTFWERILKVLGLYKEPSRPPRRKPVAREAAAKSNVRNSRQKGQEGKKESKGRTRKPAAATAKDAGENSKDFPVESPRLYLGNLSYDATEHDLEQLFKGIGTVRSVEIIYNRQTHRSKGYGFLEMLNIDEARRAVEILHDQPFMGRNLIVNGASSKPDELEAGRKEDDESHGSDRAEQQDEEATVSATD